MKKILPILLMTASLGATAEVLTPAEALERALGQSPATVRRAIDRTRTAGSSRITPALTIGSAEAPELYVITPSDGSLMILSAESETPALLGYSDTQTFRADSIPPAMQAMLETFAGEIAAVRAGIEPGATIEETRAEMEPILPLCRTTWNQDAPYNLLTPKMNAQRCMTGCVATAMAQVLRTIQWPAQCNGGTESYTWKKGDQTLSLDFSTITLDWDALRDNYSSNVSSSVSRPIATLMQALGYASHMDYSPTASGTHGSDMAEGLVKHFDYDCTLGYHMHDWYTQSEWEAMIYNELSRGIPVYCDGVNGDASMGHAFVIDGYDSDGFYHLNWGWGGLSDGYYRLTALNPTSQGIGGSNSGYNFIQGIIVGLQPGATTTPAKRPLTFMLYNSDFTCSARTANAGASITFRGGIYNIAPVEAPTMTPGLKFINEETGEVTYWRLGSTARTNTPVNAGYTSFSLRLPSDLPDGNYKVYPAAYSGNTKEYYDVKVRVGGYGFLLATLADGKFTFNGAPLAEATATDFELTSKVYPNTNFTAKATITNTSDEPYSAAVTPALFTTAGSLLNAFDPIAVELSAGESIDYDITCFLPSTVRPGTYKLQLVNEYGIFINDEDLTITVSERPAAGVMRCNSLRCVSTALNTLTFEVDATCTEGYYDQAFYVVIFRKSGTGNYLDYFFSEPLIVAAGSSAKATVTGSFTGGKVGTTYTAAAYYMNGSNQNVPMEDCTFVPFTLTEGLYGETGVEEIETETAAAAEAKYYDLQGRPVASPKAGEVYIVIDGTTVKKVRL